MRLMMHVTLFAVLCAATGAHAAPVSFPDVNLETAIRSAIGKPVGAIQDTELLAITSLPAGGVQIADLTGIELCANLEELNLSWNLISDLSRLGGLTALTTLDLSGNPVTDAAALSTLTKLQILHLPYCGLSALPDFSALGGLSTLIVRENNITDITGLTGVTSLTILDLEWNELDFIDPLAGMVNLTQLLLGYVAVEDLVGLGRLSGARPALQLMARLFPRQQAHLYWADRF